MDVTVDVPGKVVDVSEGEMYSLALTADGDVYAWGNNEHGELGTRSTESYDASPDRVAGLSSVVDIAVGHDHALAVTSHGDVYGWGKDRNSGKVGDGTTDPRSEPVRVRGLPDVAEVAAGVHHSLALTSDGDVYAWGRNDDKGSLGVDTSDTAVTKPMRVSDLSEVTDVAAGFGYSLAVTADGDVYSWGRNTNGQLGDGTIADRGEPTRVENVSDATMVSAGGWQSAALTTDGAAYTWGYSWYHRSDSDSPAERKGSKQEGITAPVRVSEVSDVAAVSADSGHAALTTDDGALYAWGHDVYSKLESGADEPRYEPARVNGIANVAALSAGGGETGVAIADGELFEWGNVTTPP